jgi:hypothetical protein
MSESANTVESFQQSVAILEFNLLRFALPVAFGWLILVATTAAAQNQVAWPDLAATSPMGWASSGNIPFSMGTAMMALR